MIEIDFSLYSLSNIVTHTRQIIDQQLSIVIPQFSIVVLFRTGPEQYNTQLSIVIPQFSIVISQLLINNHQ